MYIYLIQYELTTVINVLQKYACMKLYNSINTYYIIKKLSFTHKQSWNMRISGIYDDEKKTEEFVIYHLLISDILTKKEALSDKHNSNKYAQWQRYYLLGDISFYNAVVHVITKLKLFMKKFSETFMNNEIRLKP